MTPPMGSPSKKKNSKVFRPPWTMATPSTSNVPNEAISQHKQVEDERLRVQKGTVSTEKQPKPKHYKHPPRPKLEAHKTREQKTPTTTPTEVQKNTAETLSKVQKTPTENHDETLVHKTPYEILVHKTPTKTLTDIHKSSTSVHNTHAETLVETLIHKTPTEAPTDINKSIRLPP